MSIWHRNAPPVNWNWIHVRFHVLVIWIQSSRVSVSRNNIHECKSEVKCENWLIWTTNSVLWMQLFISHHTNERSEWVNHMSIKFNSYVNQIQFFICQSSPVVNQIQFFVHMSIKIDFCFYSFLLRGRAYMRVIISFLMFCLLTQTKTNIRNKTTSELVVVVCSY
jgi:hypothetical protein